MSTCRAPAAAAGIRRGFVPTLQGVYEGVACLFGGGYRGLVHGALFPVAFLLVAGLCDLEIVDSPEYGKPAILCRQVGCDEMVRDDRQHGVELEPHRRPRLDLAGHSRQHQRRKHVEVVGSRSDFPGHRLQDPVARSLLQESSKLFHVGTVRMPPQYRHKRRLAKDENPRRR